MKEHQKNWLENQNQNQIQKVMGWGVPKRVIVVTLLATQFLCPFAFGQAPEISKIESVKKAYLTTVKPIYEKKCFNCHSSKTEFPWYHSLPMVKQMLDRNVAEAKEAIDYTNDFPFSGKKAKDYAAMISCLNDDTMPPGLYLAGNPDAKLTEDEKKILRDWVEKAKQVDP